jgi:imidazolonepropionase-like amidohydrolase
MVHDDGLLRIVEGECPDSSAVHLKAEGLYMVPGLVDAHVHLGLPRTSRDSASDTIEAVRNRLAKIAARTLMGGVTLVRDLGDRLARGKVLAEVAGELDAPRFVSAISGLTVPKGYGTFLGEAVGNDEELVLAVRRRAAQGARVIKLFLNGGVDFETGLVSAPQFDARTVALAASEAHHYNLPLAVHANGSEAVMMALVAGADTIEHGILLNDACLAMMAERGVYWIPTLTPLWQALRSAEQERVKTGVVRFAMLSKLFEQHQRAVAKAVAMGVKVAAGTDAGSPGVGHGSLIDEIEQFVSAGVVPIDALRAGTIIAAQALGMSDCAGSIDSGRWGDFLLLRRDPRNDPNALRDFVAMYVGGKAVIGRGFQDPLSQTD